MRAALARFAGIRTFFLLGLLGGGAGLLAWWDQAVLAAVLLAAGALLGVVAYLSAVRRPDSIGLQLLLWTALRSVVVAFALGATTASQEAEVLLRTHAGFTDGDLARVASGEAVARK